MNGAGLEQFIRGAVDPARPVAVNVIDFGSDSDRATWEAVAEISGGSYQNLPGSTGPELTSAIAKTAGLVRSCDSRLSAARMNSSGTSTWG